MSDHLEVSVAAVQFVSEPFALQANLNRIEESVSAAQARGVRLVVLPELASTGYVESESLHAFAEDQQGETVQALKVMSRRYGVYLAAGFAEQHEGDIYNSLAFATPGGEVSIYRKRHLIFWEHFYFRAGHEPLIVQTGLGRIGFAICADMMYRSVWSAYRGKIDLAVVASAWPEATAQSTGGVGWILRPSGDLSAQIPAHIATELQVPVVFSNHTGPCDARIPLMGPAVPAVFSGRSAIYDRTGIRLSDRLDGEGIAIGRIQTPKEYAPWFTLSG